MLTPEQDIEDRKVIWDWMQHIWMDTDVNILLPKIASVCAKSKYSIDELEAIYWNEVYPGVKFNLSLAAGPAPEWAGFDIEWLSERILDKHCFKKPVPPKWSHPYANRWWSKLKKAIEAT